MEQEKKRRKTNIFSMQRMTFLLNPSFGAIIEEEEKNKVEPINPRYYPKCSPV